MPDKPCEFELRIGWVEKGRYFVTARFVHPGKDLEDHLLDPVEVRFDLEQLAALVASPEAYGRALSAMLFEGAGQKVLQAYRAAASISSTAEALKIRLAIQGSAPELHGIHWELLADPDDGRPLTQRDAIWFSRFLSSNDYRGPADSDRPYLKALVVVADPSDAASKWGLPPIDRQHEAMAAMAALESASRGGRRRILPRALEGRATALNIVSALKAEPYEILYLVCHGALVDAVEPRLLLQADDGTGQSVAGQEIVERLGDMAEFPRLVLLMSCESAGSSQGGAANAVGARLAAAGVPSVVAMQGTVTMETARLFTTHFLRQLVETGQVDRAVATARSTLRSRPDWWMPVLFMRSRTGRLWSDLTTPERPFHRWDGILSDIAESQVVPILGPGLVEASFGSTRALARSWAERYEFPLAPRDRDDLAQVAQYLVYRQSRRFAVRELRKHLVRHVREVHDADLRADAAVAADGTSLMTAPVTEGLLNELVTRVGQLLRKADHADIHVQLARMPAKVFVNANRDNLLRDALVEQGKRPQVQLCTWRSRGDMAQQFGPRLPELYQPSVEEPLVFHVFGNLEFPASLVLTEDDYFEFLTVVTRNEATRNLAIPGAVASAFATSGWMLLGFQPDDWDFRVLLRGILKQPGNVTGESSVRVAVQMNQSEELLINPESATEYVANFFSKQAKLETFWGTPQAFMTTLIEKCETEGLLPDCRLHPDRPGGAP